MRWGFGVDRYFSRGIGEVLAANKRDRLQGAGSSTSRGTDLSVAATGEVGIPGCEGCPEHR